MSGRTSSEWPPNPACFFLSESGTVRTHVVHFGDVGEASRSTS